MREKRDAYDGSTSLSDATVRGEIPVSCFSDAEDDALKASSADDPFDATGADNRARAQDFQSR